MEEKFIIDCAGNRVPVGDKLFSAKCWVGNSADFLESYNTDLIPGWSEDTSVPTLCILMPIYRSGLSFLPTLESVFQQDWAKEEDVEILLYVNQPLGETELLTEQTLQWVNSLETGESPEKGTELWNRIRAKQGPRVSVLFEKVSGGLGVIYRRTFASLVNRVRAKVESANYETKEEKVAALDTLMSNTVFCVVDDDLIFPDNTTLPKGITRLREEDAVLLGQTRITSVSSANPEWNEPLKGIMNQFLLFKYDLEAVNLPPRAALLKDLFHLQKIDESVPYADQIWFASACEGKERILVPVETTLEEEEYPSNAEMAAQLGKYLSNGSPEDALGIFENVKSQYLKRTDDLSYTADDVDRLVDVIKQRQASLITETTHELQEQRA